MAKHIHEISRDPGRGGCGILAIGELGAAASNELVQLALRGLINMEHRGGRLADTGDGAGLLLKPERSFFERFIAPGRTIPSANEPLVVGTVFFLHGERNIPQLTREIDMIIRREGLTPMGWRDVPVVLDMLGAKAREDVPAIRQLLVTKGHRREAQLVRALHGIKIAAEQQLMGMVNVVSLAPYTTVYKALSTAEQLSQFYPDFKQPAFRTSVVVGHRRFSTNTFSNWNLVQPFRHIAHNGEINTIKSNCRAIKDANCALKMANTLMNHGSDSAQVDRVAEMMTANGMASIAEALRRMMPPAWIDGDNDDIEHRFFEANRRAMGTLGAWEGPIAIAGTDGRILVAALDRMGLRPLRFVKTRSGRVIIASEIGTVPVDPADIVCDGQLEPGSMIIADLTSGELVPPESTTAWIAARSELDFKTLATVNLLPTDIGNKREPLSDGALATFGWTGENVGNLNAMISEAKEPIHGMGYDRPLAIFRESHPRLYSFLHQIVAVVTNPPIDPLREGGAIDTTVYLGRSPRLSRTSAYKSYPQFECEHPILTNEQMAALTASREEQLAAHRLDATFADTGKPRTLVRRIHDIAAEAIETVRSGTASLLIVSDVEAILGARLPLPMLLVVNAIHRALAEVGLRRDVSIVVESGEIHEGHDCAILLAYGATAINPYAMFDLAARHPRLSPEQAKANLVQSIVGTIRKVMSKMGITTIAGYRGSALFEAIGISSDVVEYFIPDTMSRLGGITIDDIYDDIVARASSEGNLRTRTSAASVYRREVTDALQLVARNGNADGDYGAFVRLLADTQPVYLRDMLSFTWTDQPLPIDLVAPARDIISSTITAAAMSHGALNGTAHRAIAAAFNHFSARSNSGEGGEDTRRDPGGTWELARSRIRQIASGRFGVDARYLVHADEIEIKIGQGAKPGEGGHLPGHKVTEEIATIRRTKPGVDLISPPPHHDIYSIEDLAQLITNLKELHPLAAIAVKVPSITGLGTIAVGIAKAGADVISISCFSGGTGAASSGSIEHAGLPLERGISEAHQYLSVNGVRHLVRICADGGIKSGLDIAKVLALGADEVALGTPLLIAECCTFCRGCNKGKCPEGLATADEEWHRQRFMRRWWRGSPEERAALEERYGEARDGVIRYLECVTGELREILARLGLTHPRELTGRVDLLRQMTTGNPRWDSLELSDLLLDVRHDDTRTPARDDKPEHIASEVNREILSKTARVLDGDDDTAHIVATLSNGDHAIGATLAGAIARRGGLPEGRSVHIETAGFAGQGFAFGATSGMRMQLSGYANDALAEIMSGTAQVTVVPPHATDKERIPHLIGNAAAYGATGGTLLVAGSAGQRFGVRNSGAVLVCEGVGKYAFEYMTGGIGVVLGWCGPCVGSGMTGGELFIYDPDGTSRSHLHADVTASVVAQGSEEERRLQELVDDFFETTKSPRAASIVQRWDEALSDFIHVTPLILGGN